MRSLPVRPAPMVDEMIQSLAVRTAAANFAHPNQLGLPTARGLRTEQRVAARLAELLDMPAEQLTSLTLSAYPPVLRGEAQRSQRTWLHRTEWACPRCSRLNGVVLRRWQLSLHPLCVQCPSLLTVVGTHREDSAPPDTAALDAQRLIAQDLEPERLHTAGAQRRFADLYLLCELVSATADQDWPRLPGWEHDLRAELSQPHSEWSRHPPDSPVRAAIVVFLCGRALANPARQRLLRGEAIERLAARDDDAARTLVRRFAPGALDTERRRPQVPSQRTQPVLASMIRTIQRLQRTRGLQPRHVPAWPVDATDSLIPTCDRRRELEHRAVTLHVLLAGRWHDPNAEVDARRDLGLRSHRRQRNAMLEGAVDATRAAHVVRIAERLIIQGLIDHQGLRQRLATPSGLLSTVRRQVAGLPVTSDVVLAAWCRLHQSPGPVDEATLASIRVFDRDLDPELRLRLREVLDDYLEGVDPAAVDTAQCPFVVDGRTA
ncbi:TniQ family protein [Isoptericola sp. NPDC019571]|uniref:TniQ family protein n=1 Tax=Isoptericola sp. NPDC019571 TaxID=3364008 RepID=UPI003797F916